MDDYDLDQEVLAAFSGPANDGSAEDSASGDDFDADGSGDDFDESGSESGSDDDDLDDDAEAVHPDDPDYDGDTAAKKKIMAKKSAAKRAKKQPGPKKPKKKIEKKKTSASKKRKAPAKPKSSAVDLDVDMDDEDEMEDTFTHEFDEQGYGDAEDKAKVLAMNEIDRETLLAERVEKRQNEERLWIMTRDMQNNASKRKGARSSSRAKPGKSKTDAALKALKTEKLAKQASASGRAAIADLSDDSDVGDGKRTRNRGAGDGDDDDEDDENGDTREVYEDERMQYNDLVFQRHGYIDDKLEVTHLFLPRDRLSQLVSEPFFERAIQGLFVRFKKSLSGNRAAYILCTVDSVQTLPIAKVYNVTLPDGSRVRTNRYLTLRIGSETVAGMSIDMLSNSPPTRSEFETYTKRLDGQGKRLLVRSAVDELKSHARMMTSSQSSRAKPTKEESEAHIKNQEILYPEKMNWTERRGMVTLEVETCKLEYDSALQKCESEHVISAAKAKYEEKLSALSSIESKLRPNRISRTQQLFSSMARRNGVLNTVNEKLAASRLAMETTTEGENPFARFDTTGVSYFSIKGQKVKVEGEEGVTPRGKDAGSRTPRMARAAGIDWKLCLRSWNTDEEKRVISSAPLHQAFKGRFYGLDDFDTPVSDLEGRVDQSRFYPPSMDALYVDQVTVGDDNSALAGGKAITIEEYSSRTG